MYEEPTIIKRAQEEEKKKVEANKIPGFHIASHHHRRHTRARMLPPVTLPQTFESYVAEILRKGKKHKGSVGFEHSVETPPKLTESRPGSLQPVIASRNAEKCYRRLMKRLVPASQHAKDQNPPSDDLKISRRRIHSTSASPSDTVRKVLDWLWDDVFQDPEVRGVCDDLRDRYVLFSLCSSHARRHGMAWERSHPLSWEKGRLLRIESHHGTEFRSLGRAVCNTKSKIPMGCSRAHYNVRIIWVSLWPCTTRDMAQGVFGPFLRVAVSQGGHVKAKTSEAEARTQPFFWNPAAGCRWLDVLAQPDLDNLGSSKARRESLTDGGVLLQEDKARQSHRTHNAAHLLV
ncbi:hypothetical protein DL95DRAFT_407159 [Leptodontidium sp. 2 PMI_412]|nr:hypothetical protein DL95DRAFT_407159 [Leptodontidium sp. 2 PMI_412]